MLPVVTTQFTQVRGDAPFTVEVLVVAWQSFYHVPVWGRGSCADAVRWICSRSCVHHSFVGPRLASKEAPEGTHHASCVFVLCSLSTRNSFENHKSERLLAPPWVCCKLQASCPDADSSANVTYVRVTSRNSRFFRQEAKVLESGDICL